MLRLARAAAEAAGVADRCRFAVVADEPADAIISLDTFEHFSDPEGVLKIMYDILKPGGTVLISFGPTWYHPYGGHLLSVFPWAHLIFSEQSLMRWRSDIRSDGAKHFAEVEGGLNQMTIRTFESIVRASRLHLERIELVPIRKLKRLHFRFTREFTTSVVRAKLTKSVEA